MSLSPDEALAAPWWPELLAIKDTLSYADLCARFGVNTYTLRRALELAGETKVNMPRGPKRRVTAASETEQPEPTTGSPLDRVRSKVGRVPDSEVAELAGIGVDDVKAYRREHGIAPFLRPPPNLGAPPRAAPPPAIRVQPSISEPVVLRRRPAEDGAAEETVRRPVAVPVVPAAHPLEAFRARLGTVPDGVIAAEAGLERTTVVAYRQRNGIAAFNRFAHSGETAPVAQETLCVAEPPTEPALAPERGPGGRRSKLDQHLDIVGVLSDAEVAECMGMSAGSVANYRRRNGIAPGRRGAFATEAEAVPEATEVVPDAVAVVEPARAVAPVVVVDAAPAASVAHHAFAVVALRGDEARRFAAVGVDITDALARALAGLTARTDGPWRVRSIREWMEALVR